MTEKEFNAKQQEIVESCDIPQEFHSALFGYAWQQGHSAGFEEVLIYLSDLCDILQKPFEEYDKRKK